MRDEIPVLRDQGEDFPLRQPTGCAVIQSRRGTSEAGRPPTHRAERRPRSNNAVRLGLLERNGSDGHFCNPLYLRGYLTLGMVTRRVHDLNVEA